MDLLSIEVAKGLLSEAGKIKFGENLLITAVILWVVRGHFQKLEEGLSAMVKEFKALSTALISVEERVKKLENSEGE